MAKINCKSCGCPNEVEQGTSIVICEACGTEQTVPSIDNERKTMLFNRANASRLKCDFDKALANYETILIDYPNDAEAHWGLCLCRYGIEYVDDPKTKTKIPTCHRTLYNSIFDDIDYKEAINNCDVVAKRKYQEEAEYIDRIQKNILSISQKEQPYEIFICYKETDEIGHRTRDSHVAEDIYNELINKGYKVFFSRITLESKLGLEYEPIIFAALQSSKVMLVIGSKKEYFEAVWVKNEWSRYLSFMAENKGNKYMIPCYRDMEAYDMPDEFLSLQSQNLDRLGAKQDLIRAIDKIFNRDEKKIERQTQTIVNGVNINALLKRVEILISDNDYSKANELLDEVLNNDPENAKAYILLLVIELKLNKESDLINQENELTQYRNYNRALSFATGEYKKQIEGYNEKIILRKKEEILSNKYNFALNYIKVKDYTKAKEILLSIIDYKDSRQLIENIEIFKKDDIYYNACTLKQRKYYLEAKEEFKKIIDYKDSKQLIEECENLFTEERYNKAKQLITNEDYISAKQIFSSIISYKDSKELIEQCDLLMEQQKENKYNQAKQYIEEYKLYEALNILNIIKEYKDSQELLIKVKELINKEEKYQEAVRLGKMKTKQGFTSAISILSRIEDYKNSNELIDLFTDGILKINLEEKQKQKRLYIALGIIGIIILYIIIQVNVFTPLSRYNKGIKYLNNQEYYNALETFYKLKSNYKDVEEKIELTNKVIDLDEKNIIETINYLISIGGEVDITYDGNGGNCEITHEVLKGNNISNLYEPTRIGYDFYGWMIDEKEFRINKNNNMLLKINVQANWNITKYYISYNRESGTPVTSLPSSYTYQDEVKIPNLTKSGYTFIGWKGDKGNIKKDLIISKGTVGDKNYTAIFEANEYTITFDANGGILSTNTQKVTYDSTFELPTPKKEGYRFLGWYYNNTLIIAGQWKYETDIKLTAKWVDSKIILKDGYIFFGEYPQTLKKDNVTIISSTPDSDGYYKGSDGERYAKVVAKPYNWYTIYFNDTTTIVEGSTYYFKVEPIKWKIKEENNETITLISDVILDCQMYYSSTSTRTIDGNKIYPNNYEYSDIRKWLNNDFLNKAFTEELQAYIATSVVDNSLSSTGDETNPYICNNTYDKIYLPSYKEMENISYDTRQKQLTDYAKALGCYMNTSSSYYNNGYYWLRSPYYDYSNYVRNVTYNGYVSTSNVSNPIVGVAPALTITIK